MGKGRQLILASLCSAVLLAASLGLAATYVGATTPQVGCSSGPLTVRTGQSFYFTVVVSDVLDLYAWQTDVTYSTDYLDYEGIVIGDLLRRGGAAQATIEPMESPGLVDNVAVTRLSRHTGQDGSGTIAYLFFTALKDTGSGSTSADVLHAVLVDRNALAIDKNYINYGHCRATIDDDAPPLVQPPVGARVYLPMVLR